MDYLIRLGFGVLAMALTTAFAGAFFVFFTVNPAIAALGLVGAMASSLFVTTEAYEALVFLFAWTVTAGLTYLALTVLTRA